MAKTKHHLFLDANVYLRFYKLSDADVMELDQLVMLVKSGEVKLYLTDQVRDEFNRNRDEVIADSLKVIMDQRLKPNFPRMFRDRAGFSDLGEAVKAYEDRRKQMLAEITEAAVKKELAADGLIAELFALAEAVPLSSELWETARRRYDLRNPPGKGKSYGDAVHWESLLRAVPEGQDLLLVSEDGDFRSKLDGTQVSDFLQEEWRRKKFAAVTLYPTLPDLFRAHYPDVHLLEALEEEVAARALAVRSLAGSESFQETHAGVRLVSQFADFSPQELEDLFIAAVTNTQIEWILEDDDVSAFFTKLASQYNDAIDSGLLASFWETLERHAWEERVEE